MMKETLPDEEQQRLEVLHSYQILDTPPEPEFDDITRLAAQICGTPISLVTLLDENRQWFKSKLGIDFGETGRDVAFCSHTIKGKELLLIPDASKDERFAHNPLVASNPHIRFYAGVPLVAQEGQTLGTLCVLDTVPHQLNEGQRESLSILSKQVIALLERRRALARTRESQRFLRSTLNALTANIAVLDARGTIVSVNEAWEQFAIENNGSAEATGVGTNYLEVCERATGKEASEARRVAQGIRAVLSGVTSKFCIEYPCHSESQLRWFSLCVTRFEAGDPVYAVVSHENITERKLATSELAARETKFRAIFDSVQDAILLHDDNGAYSDANPAACRILGRGREEIINRRAQDLVAPSKQHQISQLREEFRRHGQQQGELEFVRPDGSSCVLEYQAVANFLPGQHLSVLRDITERKQAERTHSYFASIIESTDDAIIGASLDGVITSWNEGAQRMLGYTAQEMVGQPFEVLVPASNREEAERLKSLQLLTKENRLLEKPLLHKDGSQIEASIHSTLVRDRNAKVLGTFIIARDITERKRAQENQMRLATIVESSRDAIIGKSLDGRIVSWNQAAELIYGYSASEIIGQHVSILVPPERAGEEERLMELHRNGEHVANFETTRLHKNGALIPISLTSSPWMNADGAIIGASQISRDITQQKRAEEAQMRLAAIVENSSDAIISKTLDGIITTWNRGAEQIYGYTAAEVIGRPMSILLPPDRLQEETAILARLRRGERIAPFETRRVCKKGHQIDVAVASNPIIDASGKIVGGASIARDVSERKQAEAERERFFSLSLDLLCVVDGQGAFLRVNPAFERILGYEPETMIGEEAFKYVHTEDRASSIEVLEQLLAGIPIVNYVNRLLCSDGSYRSILWATAPYSDQFYAAGRDITDIKVAETQREESLALLDAALESTADGILVVNHQGQIIRCNQQFLSMWHIPSEVIESKDNDLAIAFVKDQLVDPQSFEQSTYDFLNNDQHEGYDLLHFKDGRIFERYSKGLQIDGVDTGRVWSFRDITDQQQAIQHQVQLNYELEAQRRRLNDILTNVPGIVWENAIDPTTLEQRVIYVSPYVKTLLGYSTDEWVNTSNLWGTVLHPDDRERVFAESDLIVRQQDSGFLRYRLIAKDGHIVWTETYCAVERNEQGQPLVLRGVTMDITERIRAQEEQSRLAALLESTTDLVGWADPEGGIQYINPAGRTMLGLLPQEPLEGYNIVDFLPESSRNLLLNIGLPTAARQGSWQGEHAFLSRGGREIPTSQVITAHKDADGNVTYYSTVARDVSESKRAQAILERANEGLEERVAKRTAELAQINTELQAEIAERQMAVGTLRETVQILESSRKEAEGARQEAERANRAKSEFLSRMSHELRTPLNAILGFGQLLQKRSLGPRESLGVEQIVKAGRHLLQLINEVLDISRIEAGHLSLSIEAVEILPLLSEVMNLMQPLAMQRNVTLQIETPSPVTASEGCFVKADRQRLQQVMLNLVSNATKYNREGGSVTVSLERQEDADGALNGISNPTPGI